MRPMRAVGFLLMSTCFAACANQPESEDVVTTRSGALIAGALNANLTINSDWGTGYCAEIRITNQTTQPVMPVSRGKCSFSWVRACPSWQLAQR